MSVIRKQSDLGFIARLISDWLQDDISYRRRFRSYIAGMVCLLLIPVLGWVAAIYLAFRQQEFQDQRVGRQLQGMK